MDSFLTPVDFYCERLAPGAWQEPVNAASNLAFLLCAWIVYRFTARGALHNGQVRLLIALVAAIGLGSAAFHILGQQWSRILDVAFILLFQLLYLWVYLRRIGEFPVAAVVGLLLVYFVSTLAAGQWVEILNGSLIYAPALLLFTGLAVYHRVTKKIAPNSLLAAASLFTLSLVFRTVDATVCTHWPTGTHFLWHLFNALVLYLLLRGLLVNLPASARHQTALS